MDLSDLVIFRAVAREGGIVRASRVLHRVQSNVTTRIQQLEESVGAQLFHRDRQRLHLSPDGERLLAYADRLLQLADEARAAVGNGPPRGTLRLGALESTSASRLPAILSAFHVRYAEVGVELTTGTNDALIEAVSMRRLDAAFVAETPRDPRLSHASMFRERLVLITSLAHRPVRHALDVADETVIVFPNGCAYRRVIQRWLGDRGLQAVRTLELGSYHAIVACVASGTGIAIIPESVLETVRSAEVARHRLPKVLSEIVTPMVWRAGEETQAAGALRTLARAMTRGRDSDQRAADAAPSRSGRLR